MSKLWERSYPPGIRWDAPISTSTLTAELDAAVARYATRPFLEFMGLELDFQTLGGLVERVASGLRALGVGPGVPVALHLPNCPQYPIAFYGVLKAGGVVVNLSPLDAERELTHKLAKAGVAVVVSHVGLTDKLPAGRPGLRIVVCGPGDLAPAPAPPIPADPATVVPFAALLDPDRESQGPWPVASPDSLAVLQFTGGTTGMPKAAVLTHANITAAVSIMDMWTIDLVPGEERLLMVLPLFHIFGLAFGLCRGVRSGNQLILKTRWDTDDIIATLKQQKPTMFGGVPTMFRALVAHPRAAEIEFSSLRYCSSGGAPLPLELQEAFEALSGRTLLEGWGMTETAAIGTGMTKDARRSGSAGLPLPGIDVQIRGIDDPRVVLGPGEKGEICIGGAPVTQGYYQQPEENEEAFVDGLFRTGDIGYLDEDGFLFIVDRKKDMILSGGFNVYPRYVEEAIYEHPSVEEVIVIGVSDAYRGESAKAFIKLRAGAPGFTIDELRTFLQTKLGKHELPVFLEFRDALPKTAVGKLWKRALIDEERAKGRPA